MATRATEETTLLAKATVGGSVLKFFFFFFFSVSGSLVRVTPPLVPLRSQAAVLH